MYDHGAYVRDNKAHHTVSSRCPCVLLAALAQRRWCHSNIFKERHVPCLGSNKVTWGKPRALEVCSGSELSATTSAFSEGLNTEQDIPFQGWKGS